MDQNPVAIARIEAVLRAARDYSSDEIKKKEAEAKTRSGSKS